MTLNFFIKATYLKVRKIFYSICSDIKFIEGNPIIVQPILFKGNGRVIFGEKVSLGYLSSPHLLDGSGYIEARNINSIIKIGNNVFINNNFVAICEKSKIYIGDDCLIGHNVEIYDSDFHNISPKERLLDTHICEEVYISKNVFIGAGVKILKGTFIGENTVVAMGALVTGKFPDNVIIGGVPARIIKKINE